MGTPSGPGTTRYSDKVPGQAGNYCQPVRFDMTGNYVGITQWKDDGIERVLLSPAQVRALKVFVCAKGRRARP